MTLNTTLGGEVLTLLILGFRKIETGFSWSRLESESECTSSRQKRTASNLFLDYSLERTIGTGTVYRNLQILHDTRRTMTVCYPGSRSEMRWLAFLLRVTAKKERG